MERTSPAIYFKKKQTGINKFLVIIYPLLEGRGGLTTDAVNTLYVKVHY